jgi:hypothetical protein
MELDSASQFTYQTWCRTCRRQQWKHRDGKKREEPNPKRLLPRKIPDVILPEYGPEDDALVHARRKKFIAFVHNEFQHAQTRAEKEALIELILGGAGYDQCTGIPPKHKRKRKRKRKKKKKRK